MLAPAWMDLEDMMLSEISQMKKDKYSVNLLTGGPQRSHIHRDRKQMVGPGAGGGGVFDGDRASVWEDEKVLEMDGGDGCTAI